MTAHSDAIDTLARAEVTRALDRRLDTSGWPVRQMRVVDKAAIRARVQALRDQMAPTGDVELAYDVIAGRGEAS